MGAPVTREWSPMGDSVVATAWIELPRRANTVVYVADAGEAGRWHYVSPQIAGLLGFEAEEWCADPALWLTQLHPDDSQRALRGEDGNGIEPGTMTTEHYRMRHREGHIVWIRDEAVLVAAPDGTLRWHGLLSDITDHKLLEDELERRVAQQAAVARLGEHALEGAGTAALMQEAVTAAAELIGVEFAAVLELLPEQDCFAVRAGFGPPPSPAPAQLRRIRIPAGRRSQAGYTLLSGEQVVVSDWEGEHRFAPTALRPEIRSGLTVAIEGRRGPFAVLSVQSASPRAFTARDVDFVQSLANVLADALERQATEDLVRHRSLHDPLTGLPNRVLFHDRLEQALVRLRRRTKLAAVLFMDLDRFKLVNDSLGHHAGDELLVSVVPRLRAALRGSDTVARFGGDEFAILLEDIVGEEEAIEVAERVAAVFAQPYLLAGSEHFISTSIGIAIARGGQLADDLIRDADAAMYRAKERGRARWELFDEVMRGHAIARLGVENDLRHALERDELQLAYQPIISLREDRIVGVEALLRWHHPARGWISPAEFVPIAEEAGLIEPIGRWALATACHQTAEWNRSRPEGAGVEISVNLSAVQIGRPKLPHTVADTLHESGLDPARLSLEITESAMLRGTDAVSTALPALKEVGVKLALDDFGTGYSSLGYITLLPLDALKIDRSFINGLGVNARDTALTEAIIAMGHALSLGVVAEGVETGLQREELARLGCDRVQGFYFARPLPAVEVTSLLAGPSSPGPER